MKYRKLGTTDLDVSVICLGTMTWGEQNNQDDGFQQMDYAFERGVNLWDELKTESGGSSKDNAHNSFAFEKNHWDNDHN